MTEKAFENALTIDMALGGSTNSLLHLPAIAHECDLKIDLDMANRISDRTPTSATLPRQDTIISKIWIEQAAFVQSCTKSIN